MNVLVLEDKLGITSGYQHIWDGLLEEAYLSGQNMRRVSIWRSPLASKITLLTRKGNRKSPGFNPDPMVLGHEAAWLRDMIRQLQPHAILCMDVAMLGMVEPDWDVATIDNLRGGVYRFDSIPFIVTVPISAVHSQKKPKDIRAMNEGYESADEWEEAHGEQEDEEFFFEPYTIPFGRWILVADLRKLARTLKAISTSSTP